MVAYISFVGKIIFALSGHSLGKLVCVQRYARVGVRPVGSSREIAAVEGNVGRGRGARDAAARRGSAAGRRIAAWSRHVVVVVGVARRIAEALSMQRWALGVRLRRRRGGTFKVCRRPGCGALRVLASRCIPFRSSMRHDAVRGLSTFGEAGRVRSRDVAAGTAA